MSSPLKSQPHGIYYRRPLGHVPRPLIGGRIHRPRCKRPNPDRPLPASVEAIRRALAKATYRAQLRAGHPSQELAVQLVVDDWLDRITAPHPTDWRSTIMEAHRPPPPPIRWANGLDA